jgi:hypothetical protein
MSKKDVQPVAWVDLLKEADQIVKNKPTWKRFIDGTPLSNDIAVWMADFAQRYATPALDVRPAIYPEEAREMGLEEVPYYTHQPASPDVQPVAWMYTLEYGDTVADKKVSLGQLNYPFGTPLYAHPAPTRQPLTDEQIDALQLPESGKGTIRDLVRIIEAAHGIGGSDDRP